MPRPSRQNSSDTWGDKGVYTFPKGICSKVNCVTLVPTHLLQSPRCPTLYSLRHGNSLYSHIKENSIHQINSSRHLGGSKIIYLLLINIGSTRTTKRFRNCLRRRDHPTKPTWLSRHVLWGGLPSISFEASSSANCEKSKMKRRPISQRELSNRWL